jgi:N-acetylmuramoyl-L-alanine amidase
MHFCFSMRRSVWVFWLTAAMTSALGSVLEREALAGQAGGLSERRPVVSPQSTPALQPPDSISTRVTKIRVGVHEGFTRVVLDLGGTQEWSLDQPAGAPVRLILPGVGLDSAVRRLDFPKGTLRSVQPIRWSGGVEVLLVCEPAQVRVRTLTLTDPDRLVLDVMLPGAGEDGRAFATGRSAPAAPSSGSGAVAAAEPAPSASAPSGLEVPSSSAGQRSARARATPSPPEKTPVAENGNTVASGTDREDPAAPLTVVLDPGHGGHDTGAIGPSGLMEKDVVLDLALRLRRLLQERLRLRVRMTRTEDVFVPLAERSAFANRVKADFLISLHVNAANKRGAIGFETFYFTREPSDNDARASAQRENLVLENNGAAGKDLESLLKTTLADMAVTRDMKESGNLAERILSSLETILRVENRGVKSGPFYVLATAAMPAVLVESAFITNPREERKLQREEYRQRIAHALFEGIAAYKIRYEQRLGLRNTPAGVGS